MKKYILLGWAGWIAGGQIFMNNACDALLSLGYEVHVFYCEDAPISMPAIQKTHYHRVPWMSAFPSYFGKAKRGAYLREMRDLIAPAEGDDITVESHDVRYSYWGELLAASLHAKHYLFALEAFFPYPHTHGDFLRFKLARKELAGTRPASLPQLLQDEGLIDREENTYFSAYCMNSVMQAEEDDAIPFDENDIVLTYIGRAKKPCFLSSCRGVRAFALRHPEKKILFLCIGPARKEEETDAALPLFADLENLTWFTAGSLFPIPEGYIQKTDLLFGSSGSAIAGAAVGTKAISYLDTGEEPMGVLGYDLVGENYPSYPSGMSFADLADAVLFGGYCDRFTYRPFWGPMTEEVIRPLLCEQIAVRAEKPASYVYYPTERIRKKGLGGLLRLVYHRIRNAF